jgi:tetratricopeptide (TPR) repeat protein
MEVMERASLHHSQHHSKAVSPPATRGPAWLTLATLAALALATCGANAARGSAIPRQHSAGATAEGPSRRLAERDVLIGRYYFNIGKYEASISRFQSAVARDPGWSVPHEWLGEAYEKKDELRRALAEYREYLKIAPHAKDAKKIKERVEKLSGEMKDSAAARR